MIDDDIIRLSQANAEGTRAVLRVLLALIDAMAKQPSVNTTLLVSGLNATLNAYEPEPDNRTLNDVLHHVQQTIWKYQR